MVAGEALAGMYMDPKLSRNRNEYAWFLLDMQQKRSMFEFGTTVAAVTLGMLVVEKKITDSAYPRLDSHSPERKRSEVWFNTNVAYWQSEGEKTCTAILG